MSTTEHSISPSKVVRRAIAMPVWFIVWGLVLYLLAAIFKFDLIGLLKHKKEPVDQDLYFWIFVGSTVICVPWALLAAHTAQRLAKHGVVVQATLTSLGLHKHGMTACGYTYEYNGRTFGNRVDMGDEEAHAIGIGGQFPILVDPAKPSRSKPRSDIFPE